MGNIQFEKDHGYLKQISKEDDAYYKGKVSELMNFILKNNVQDLAVEEDRPVQVKIKGVQSVAMELDTWSEDVFNYFISRVCRVTVGGRALPRGDRLEYDEEIVDILMKLHEKSYDFSVKYKDKSLRVHLFYGYAPKRDTRSNIMMMIRVIDLKIPTWVELNVPNLFKEVTKIPSGLFLFAGPVGAGKSTTVASALNTLNLTSPKRMTVLTIENPIEFVYDSESVYFIQREVGNNVPSFSKATDDAMRENADIVVIGELRDEGEMDNALRLAEIGKLVIATIHSNSVEDTPERFINAFNTGDKTAVRNRLRENLIGIMHQNLEVIEGKQFPKVEGVLAKDRESRKIFREYLESRNKLSELMDKAEYSWVYDYEKSFNELQYKDLFIDQEEARRVLVPREGEEY